MKLKRTENFGINFKDGLAENWVFGVPAAFRKQLDIVWQQYVDKGKTKELWKKDPGLRWENDQLPTVYRMAWSRGVPPLLCFEVGDVVYDPPDARNMAWVDALKILRRAVQVIDAKPNTEPGIGGWVKFDLRYYNAGKVVFTEELTLSNAEFESFLRTGQLPLKAQAPAELMTEPAL
jgi:hypothetical protein